MKKKKKKKKIEQQTRYSLFEYGDDCFTLIHSHDERAAIRVFFRSVVTKEKHNEKYIYQKVISTGKVIQLP